MAFEYEKHSLPEQFHSFKALSPLTAHKLGPVPIVRIVS